MLTEGYYPIMKIKNIHTQFVFNFKVTDVIIYCTVYTIVYAASCTVLL